ncbi:MAG: hypothetical protein M3119_07120, partial [Verrucomicrobiota bacterium]|nr:hypothetical protein [Verrucomicrobiota bacterium]
MKSLLLFTLALLFIGCSRHTFAQTPTPALTRPFIAADADPATATRAWLDTVPPEKKARSDAYFEGGYWLLLWDFLATVAISLFLLQTRISARMRDFAERTTRLRVLQVSIYAICYLLITSVLIFPLNAYEHYFREHAYDLSTQTFGPWFREQLIGLVVALIGFTLLMIALYGVFKRAPRTWWIWATAIVVSFFMVGAFLAPVYIEPLFNKYKPL